MIKLLERLKEWERGGEKTRKIKTITPFNRNRDRTRRTENSSVKVIPE